jgi:glycosyltransferase 2 family protein
MVLGYIKKWRKTLISLQYLVVIIIFFFLFRWSKGVDFPRLNYLFLTLAILSLVLFRSLSVVRLHFLLRRIFRVPWVVLIPVQLLSLGVGLFTPGKLGESLKVFLLPHDRRKSGAVFILEKLLDLSMFIPFSIFFMFTHPKYAKLFLLILVLLGMAVLAYVKLKKFSQIDIKLLHFDVVLVSLLVFVAQTISFWFIVLASGTSLSFTNAAIIWSVGAILTIVSALPGGLGAREFSVAFLLSLFTGINTTLAVSLAITHTIINYTTTWLMVFVSMVVFRKSRITSTAP